MSDPTPKDDGLEREITTALNRHCAENASNTPDWILAQYLLACLAAWNVAVQQRETWYGRAAQPTGPPENQPIYTCLCGAPMYTFEGFCGVCGSRGR